jgi:anti-repressor protein
LEGSFDKGFDFCCEFSKNGQRGRPLEKIFLTIDCFKQFCMMAGTQKGKEVRRYFINCESELKKLLQQERDRNKKRVVASKLMDTRCLMEIFELG